MGNLPQIDSYSFGRMQIGQKLYNNDLIIFPDGRIQDSWWRKDGHKLRLKDLSNVIKKRPNLIIAGTGANGRMSALPEVKPFLADQGIEFIALPTAKAADVYNEKKESGAKICACFHLTC